MKKEYITPEVEFTLIDADDLLTKLHECSIDVHNQKGDGIQLSKGNSLFLDDEDEDFDNE